MRSLLISLILFFISYNVYSNEKKNKKILKKNLSYVNIEPNIFLSSIRVYDTYNEANGNINSNYNYGLNISWNEAVSYSLQYKIVFDYKIFNFKKEIEDKIFTNNKFNIYGFGLGLKNIINKNLILDLDLLFSEIFFIRFINSESIVSDRTYALVSSLNIYYAFYNHDNTRLAIELKPVIIFPNNIENLYMTKMSYGASLGISLRYRIIKILLLYKSLIKDTKILKQNQRDIILQGSLSWQI